MKTIINHLINFITTILLVCLTFLIIVNITLLNEKFVLNMLNKNNYYDQVYQNIISTYENNTASLGIDFDFKKVITKDMITTDVNNLIKSIYHNEDINLSINKLENKLESIISEYNPTNAEKEQITELTNNLKDMYEEEIFYSRDIMSKLTSNIVTIKNITTATTIILALIIVNLMAITMYILKRKASISTPFLACGLINIAVKILIGNSYQNFLIINNDVSNILIELLNSIMDYILIFGIVYFAIGLCIRIWITIKKEPIITKEFKDLQANLKLDEKREL